MIDWNLMNIALELAENSVFEDQRPHPRVGALLADKDGRVHLTAYRGQFGRGDHAEFLLLEKAKENDVPLGECTLFTTLEPCTSRGHRKIPCATRIANSGVRKVAVGMVDPNPRMRGLGIHELQSKGVEVLLAPPSIYNKIVAMNCRFIGQFPDIA